MLILPTLRYSLIPLVVLTSCLMLRTSLADVIVTGDASVTDLVSAGGNGTDGAVTINGGSIVTAPAGAVIGWNSPASSGDLFINGAGSELALGGGPGHILDVGLGEGNGYVEVANFGLLTIDAFDSPDWSDVRLNVGRGGTGTVFIRSGAQVFVQDVHLQSNDDGIMVGTSANSPDLPGFGVIWVKDEGTYLEVKGNLAFLNAGISSTSFTGTASAEGFINISDGADVVVDGSDSLGVISVGRGGNAQGNLDIWGNGTTVLLTGTQGLLSIGDSFTGAIGSGTGDMHVYDNAEVNLRGEFGGEFRVGTGEAQGDAVIETGARVHVGPWEVDPFFGGRVTLGGSNSAGGDLYVRDTAVLSAGTIRVFNNGVLAGDGTIIGDVDVRGGTVNPGASPGKLFVDGGARLRDGGAIEIEVAPSESDLLEVTGEARFDDGIIRFIFLDGASPVAGDSLTFIDAGSITGLNENPQIQYEVEGLLDGFEFSVDASNGLVQITAETDGIPEFVEPLVQFRPGEVDGVNPKSNQIFPVAVLTTQIAPLFDALDVDPTTVHFGVSNALPVLKKSDEKDVDNDGDLDLRLWFRIKQTGISCGDLAAEINGYTYSGTSFSAQVDIFTEGC
jgi:hypothetical protein